MNSIARPFQIQIINPGEIRMGSPYNICDIELIGIDKIKLPKQGWQDKYAWSDDGKTLVLIQWDLTANEPGFCFFIIDTEAGLTTQSERIAGLVNYLSIEGNNIMYNKFLLDREKSESGTLCCNTHEVFSLNNAWPTAKG